MSARRGWRLDLAAVVVLLSGLLMAVCVFSHDPADAPGSRVFPHNDPPANLLGAPGAALAHQLHETLGVAVHALLACWFVLVLLLFLRQRLFAWLRRLCGWLLLVPASAVLADGLAWSLAEPPLAGSGGTVGAWLGDWLSARVSVVGRWLIVGLGVLAGILLCSDFAPLGWLRGLARGLLRLGRALPQLVFNALPRPKFSWPTRAKPAASVTSPAAPVPVDAKPASPAVPERDIPIHHSQAAPTVNEPAPMSDGDRFADFELPANTMLEDPQPFPFDAHDQLLRERAALLEKTFADFSLNVRVVGINTGPVVTQFEVALETGLRVNKVTRMGDDLAINLKVPSVRIVAPIPGKNTVGIEIPNEHRAVVRLKEVIRAQSSQQLKQKLPLFLGKDAEGKPLVYDLAEMPHLLIAGRTGTGKSVCLNAIILSLLMTRRPDEVKMIMIDPKKLEMSEYGKIPHLMHPVVDDMKKAEAILAWAVDKMEERYDVLSRVRVRNLASYNELSQEEIMRRLGPIDEEQRRQIPDQMPYIVIFIDEMADLMMQMRKEVETHIIRLAQKSRAAGIHLVVATQKPTVDVITGLIKSNLPARICFQVASRTDSQVVLDDKGAERLLGKGDMLFSSPGTGALIRAQGTYASDKEITRVVEFLETDEPCYAEELIQLKTSAEEGDEGDLHDRLRARDELYEQAVEVIIREGRGSVSLLQRALGIGYGKAARFIDFMAEDGIVGDYNGSHAREVIITPEQWTQMRRHAG